MWYVLLAAVCGAITFFVVRALLAGQAQRLAEKVRSEAEARVQRAKDEAREALAVAQREAGEAARKRRQHGDREIEQRQEMLHKARERIARREQALGHGDERLRSREEIVATREQALQQLVERKRVAEAGRVAAVQEAHKTVQRVAEETVAEARDRLVTEWVEQVRSENKDTLRQLDQNSGDPEYVRHAKRILDIASQRYRGHYLTERLLSNLPLPAGAVLRIGGPGQAFFQVISEVANVKLSVADDELAVRLEGQDSFGREIARRALSRFMRNPPRQTEDGVRKAVVAIAEELDRETVELGKRAFKELEIPRAHPEIVRLVGRLNYRTSYTQNQWKHAVESAFLCGMMAAELQLNLKIARRAALMHDIGKALTHEIDGSHAVIGADYARRLGESEIVANAIGAHHTDEPFHSPYALIVAAADAMSGARPGARHEQADNYVQRIEDLERIAASLSGIERVYAVQAGREVRIHVRENQVSDVRAAEMSTEIAGKISEGMVFPGQIKVTVIREVMATAIAS